MAVLEKRGGPIDYLVTDLEMPRMGGIELAEEVVGRWKDTRVLFLSGYSSDRLVGARPPVRGARFLQKPFTDEAVLRELRRLEGGEF
jgi:CheY-like chemotaxis protein